MAEYEDREQYEDGDWFHRRRHHHAHHLTVDLLFGLPQTNPQENLIMAETTFPVTPDVKIVDSALGAVRDLQGNVNTKDPVASGTWTAADATLGSVVTPDADPTGLTAALNLLGVEGALEVDFTGFTVAGVTVTGKGLIDIAAGPPATVDLAFSVPAPVAPATAAVADPAAPPAA